MKDFIRKKLSEVLSIPSLRLPQNTSITPDELNQLKAVSWSDIKIDDLGVKVILLIYRLIFHLKPMQVML